MAFLLDLLRIPSRIFTFEGIGGIEADTKNNRPLDKHLPEERHHFGDYNSSNDHHESDHHESDDSSDASDSDSSSSNSDDLGNEASSDLGGLSGRHRNHSSVTLMPLGRSRAPKRRIQARMEHAEAKALRELRFNRTVEKHKLYTNRQNCQDAIQSYQTWKEFSPRLEVVTWNDPLDPENAVALAKRNNAIYLQDTMAEIESYASELFAQIEAIAFANSSTSTKRPRNAAPNALFARIKWSLGYLEDLCEIRYADEKERLKELARERARKDSVLA